jgi:hypothetical protein
VRTLTAVVMAVLPLTAAAQEQPSQRPIVSRAIVRLAGAHGDLSPEDRTSYCFWAGQLYSIGAAFCSRQQTFATCTGVAGGRPVWVNKENDKFCDRNSSPTPE